MNADAPSAAAAAERERRWFGQEASRARLEWGRRGALLAAARGDVLIVVDVLSFATAAVTAVARGAAIYPWATQEEAETTAARVGGVAAVNRRDVPARGRFSLSPGTMEGARPGQKIAVASPNGATCARHGRNVPALFVGALVNARAVADAAARAADGSGAAVTVLACGERWGTEHEDGPLRWALEDLIGAGAILSALPAGLSRSPEARAAEAASAAALADGLEATLRACGGGIELTDKGYADDVTRAARLDAFDVAPRLVGEAFIAPASNRFL